MRPQDTLLKTKLYALARETHLLVGVNDADERNRRLCFELEYADGDSKALTRVSIDSAQVEALAAIEALARRGA